MNQIRTLPKRRAPVGRDGIGGVADAVDQQLDLPQRQVDRLCQGVPHQVLQQLELALLQLDRAAAAHDPVGTCLRYRRQIDALDDRARHLQRRLAEVAAMPDGVRGTLHRDWRAIAGGLNDAVRHWILHAAVTGTDTGSRPGALKPNRDLMWPMCD